MKRNGFRTKGALVASVLLSVGTFAGAGTVEAAATGCSWAPSSGGTYTGSRCTSLTGGSGQYSYQWCPAAGVGWQYGPARYTSGTWSNTPACSLTPNSRGQYII